MPPIDTTQTTPVTVTANDVLVITGRGTIVAGVPVTLAPGADVVSLGAIIANAGDGIYSYTAFNSSPNTGQTSYLNLGPTSTVLSSTSSGIAATGAIYMDIYNSGAIQGTYDGVTLNSAGGKISNSGTIIGQYNGIYMQTRASSSVLNSGDISGQYAVSAYLISASGLTFTLDNSGTITGSGSSFSGGEQRDIVINSGVMHGDIDLYFGNDFLDTSIGRVAGQIAGGAGDDIIIGSNFNDTIFGDDVSSYQTGADTLTGGFGDDVLTGGKGADILYGNQDNDVLYGNLDNDWLHGGQGDDVLYGGQGNDTLNGGKGDDVLFGNLGDDLFVYSAAGFGHDAIGDFRSGGANDRVQFSTDIFADFGALQARAAAVSNGTLLTDGAGDTLLLVGIAPGALTAAMFVFG